MNSKSRRSFLKFDLNKSKENQENSQNDESIKMLTPDGILVEIKKSLIAGAADRKRATNKDILKWVKNKPL